jgi:hypothetical protein
MKTKLLSLLFLFIIAKNFAQTDKDIIGEWQFYDFGEDANIDEAKRATGAGLFSSMQFNFNADKTYTASILSITEQGTWKLNGQVVEFTTQAGNKYHYNVLKFEKNILTLDFKGKPIQLGRKGVTLPPPGPKAKIAVYVRTSKAQLCKKWYLKQKTAPENMTPQQMEAFGEMLSGSYIEFKNNGGYISQIGDTKENGKWRFDEGDTAVITQKGSEAKYWHILKVTATDLVLVYGDTNEEWTFSTFE